MCLRKNCIGVPNSNKTILIHTYSIINGLQKIVFQRIILLYYIDKPLIYLCQLFYTYLHGEKYRTDKLFLPSQQNFNSPYKKSC